MLFVEAPTSEADIERVATELRGVAPLVFNAAEGGRTPPLPLERVAELGFGLVIYPIATLLAATAAVQSVLGAIRRDGTPHAVALPTFEDVTATVGLPEINALESRFGG